MNDSSPLLRTGLVLAGWSVAALLSGCGRDAAPGAEVSLPALKVTAARAEKTEVPNRQPVAGTVRPLARATVAAKVMGSVAQADFTVGQTVAADETLVELSAAEIDARVEQAKAALAQARRDYEREAALLAKGAATTEEVRSLEDRRRIAEAALAEATTMQSYTRIVAPFAGVVTRKHLYAGDLAAPGTPLFEIEGTTLYRAEVQVPESLGAVALGAMLPVSDGEAHTEGSLAEISPAADPLSRTRLAKIDLPADSSFRSGQFVRVLWPAGETCAISVPASAVTVFGQMERVFVIEDGKVRLRLVKTGAREGGNVQILAGLDAGETVVLDAPAGLRDGQPVEVTP